MIYRPTGSMPVRRRWPLHLCPHATLQLLKPASTYSLGRAYCLVSELDGYHNVLWQSFQQAVLLSLSVTIMRRLSLKVTVRLKPHWDKSDFSAWLISQSITAYYCRHQSKNTNFLSTFINTYTVYVGQHQRSNTFTVITNTAQNNTTTQ